MKTFFITLIALFLTACASVSTNVGPSYMEWDNGEPMNFVKITFNDPDSFTPGTTTTVVLECKTLPLGLLKDLSDVEQLEKSKCRPVGVNHNAGPGTLTGLGNSIITGASVVGGAYFIGKGIGGSGDSNYSDTHNTNVTDQRRSDIDFRKGSSATINGGNVRRR